MLWLYRRPAKLRIVCTCRQTHAALHQTHKVTNYTHIREQNAFLPSCILTIAALLLSALSAAKATSSPLTSTYAGAAKGYTITKREE